MQVSPILARPLALLALLALTACGFQPLYGPRGGAASPVAAELSTIRVAPIADRKGQLLRNELEQRLTPKGEPARAGHELTVTLAETIEKLGFRRDATATIANMRLTAEFRLRASGSDQPQVSGRANTVISYDISDAAYETLVAEADARQRAVRQLADEITLRIAAHFSEMAAAPPVKS